MEKLVEGIHKFQASVFRPNQEFFQQLAGGQSPQALFIGCSDSRIIPDLITQAAPGDLFVLRNAGNLVPPHGCGGSSGAEAAAIEYAVRGLGVKDIIICGHTRCGAMKALLEPDGLAAMPRVREWLRHADATREVVESVYPGLAPEARWKVTVEENVLAQLENLRTHPAVAVGLAIGELKLHGWVYKIETGQVFAYDPEAGQFVPVVRPDGVVAVPPIGRTTILNGRPASAREAVPGPAAV